MKPLTLFIDADDTLWDNNVFFERVVAAFCDLMAARGAGAVLARSTLNAIERERTKKNGYGVKNFHASLCQACQTLLGDADLNRELAVLQGLCADLARHPVLPFAGVHETLHELSGRHRLILFTKGDLDDQQYKVQQSGLRKYLHQVDVVREKDVTAYADAVLRHGVKVATSWMIGNSPKSDIRPALEAGLGAVFIPHPSTWELEHDELPQNEDARLLVLEQFSELTRHF